MCGIVGFTGHQQAAPILLDGLSKLEYRGYDSAGNGIQINICGSESDDLKRNLTGQMVEKTPNQWWIYFFFHDK